MSISKKISNFSIKQICESGQCFRMKELSENEYEVIAFGKYLKVRPKGDITEFDCTEEEFNEIWAPYFDFETDYQKIIDAIDKNDKYLINAANNGEGIRILRQDLFEMIISFIISQRNNIKRIRKCIALLCERFGEKKVAPDGSVYYDFPTAEALYNADVEDIKSLGVGYRDIYIKKAAEAVFLGEIDLSEVEKMDYLSAKETLLKLYGVGEKVADCICLFSLHKTESFPKDTHINQVLEREYKCGFPFDKYGDKVGILQQYMFYNEL